MTENYLTLLEESLKRKLQVMAEIQKYNLRQQELFQTGSADIDQFDDYVAEKGELIERLSALDSGFEKLYAKVAEQLKGNREQYAVQIKRLQGLVTEVTDVSVQIQAQEARNKKLIEDYFRRERDGIRDGRKSSKAAINYYRNMNKSAVVPPHFLDSKK
ncbi:MAG: flagellar protein FliT [Lachnospiraceae bacterium]|nr:flagellar protein FliT [Lachnospiraceae bacterium]